MIRRFVALAGFTLLGVAVALGGITITSSPAYAGGGVNCLAWEGYCDPVFTKAFEDETGCKVTQTDIGSNDEIIAKMAAGASAHDIISPSTDTTTILMKMGVVEPIDVSRLEHWDEVYDVFRSDSGVIGEDGLVYGVPYAWGADPFMYRSDMIDEELTSLASMFDPKYAGKISMLDDKYNLYWTARLLFGKDVNYFDLTDEQLEQVKQKLIEQKPLVRTYWKTGGELVNLMASGEVWLSQTWGDYQSSELRDQGIPITVFTPEEGVDGWMDAWQIVKGTPNEDCVYKFLNFAIGPGGQCGMVQSTRYSGSNPVVLKECLTPEDFTALHQDDVAYLSRILMYHETARPEKYNDVWNAVKAAGN